MEQTMEMAILFSFLAGASTGIGGLLAFLVRKDNFALLAIGLGFSAGVMVYVSFMEMLPQAQYILTHEYGPTKGGWLSTGLFFSGVGVAYLIDHFMPSHHVHADALEQKNRLKQVGLFTALALAIHNFPEGLATFMATLENATLGISVAVAVGVHNVPEGIAVALPIYHATGSKVKAFGYSALSGLTEPIGALIGFVAFKTWLQESTLGVLFAGVAGMMVYISLDELLPTAHEYGEGHAVIGGIVAGMAVMSVTLLLF